MSGLLPSFLRASNSTTERNGATTSSSGGGTRRASAPSTAPAQASIIPAEDWSRRLHSIHLSRTEINQLVMNYLVIEGYKDAAERFSRESNVVPPGELAAIEERMQVRSAIQRGALSDAISRINDLEPDLLDSHPRLAFHLQQQRMIELVREGKVETALEFAQEELAPRAECHPEYLRELERTMSLLIVEGSSREALLDVAHRVKVANEVNAALLAVQSQENESKLPALLRLLHNLQETLAKKVTFPRIVDFTTAKFDVTLPTLPECSVASTTSSTKMEL